MKKNWKRLGALLMALAMVLSLVPTAALAAGITDDAIAIEAPGTEGIAAKPAEAPAELLDGETPEYNDTNVDAGLFDMGATVSGSEGSWSATYDKDSVGFTATAGSQATTAQGEDVSKALDGNAGTLWSTAWQTSISAENMWYQFALTDAAVLTAVRYQQRSNHAGGVVTGYEIKVCHEDNPTNASNWITVATGTRTSSSAGWTTAKFDFPVYAKYVRFYGTATTDVANGLPNHTMSAAEFRVVKPTAQEHTRTLTVTVTKQNGGAPIENATVVVGGQTATTNASGEATINNLIPNQAYTATASAADYASGTVDIAADATTGTIALQGIERTVTGKVVDGAGANLPGATVTLVNNNVNVTPVANVSAVTTGNDGTFTLSVNAVAAGSYKVRASKAGYDAAISGGNTVDTGTVAIAATEITETVALADDITLTAIDTSAAKFAYDMTTGHRPELSFAEASTHPTVDWTGDKMKLDFPARDTSVEGTDGARMNRLVKLVGTNVKNGTIEFDATRGGTGVGRFGLAIRLTTSTNWIFVGQWDNNLNWASEYWPNSSNSDYSRPSVAGPSFGSGDTRHFKVKINDNQVTLWIDGVQVYDQDLTSGTLAVPSTAADVGFICGNNDNQGLPATITVDNLYIFREDPTYTVDLTADATLAAKITSSAGDSDLGGNGQDQASVGDVIKITGTPAAGNALDAITVKKVAENVETDLSADELAALKITFVSENVFTFVMPSFGVKITGTARPKITGVTLSPADTAKVGETITATVTPAEADGKVTYQWYHLNNEGQEGAEWITCTDDTAQTKTKTVSAEDQGKKVKVVVTGNGTDYASTVSASATSGENMKPADAVVGGITTKRTNITFIKNGDANDNVADSEGNKTTIGDSATTTLVLSLNTDPSTLADGQEVEPYTVEWASSDEDVAAVEAISSDTSKLTATVTAKAVGTATITATLTRSNVAAGTEGRTVTATCSITVKNKATGVEIRKGNDADEINYDAPIVVYANETGNSVTLKGKIVPEGAEGTLNWFRQDLSEDFITTVDRTVSGQVTITARNSATEQKLGQVAWWVSLGGKEDDTAIRNAFTIEVRRNLANPVSLQGNVKVGGKLSVNTAQLAVYADPDNTDGDSGKAKLNYAWYALENSTDSIASDATPIHTGQGDAGKSYTLKITDHGKYIVAVVSATPDAANNFFYDGSVTTPVSAQVAKADGAAAPTGLLGTSCTTDDNNDGTITGLAPSTTYGVKYRATTEGATWGDYTSPTMTSDTSGVIGGLDPGDYKVFIPGDATTEDGAESAVVTILAKGANAKQITQYTSAQGSATTERAKVEPTQTVTITVTPATGYQLKANTLKVAHTDDSAQTAAVTAVEGQAGKYTFTMPDAAVTITAEFEPIDLTITHDLGEGLSCSLGSTGSDHTHTVKYGTASTSITISATTGFAVMATAANDTVTKTGGGDLGEDYYTYVATQDRSSATITFPHGITDNLTIKVTSSKRTYAVGYSLTNGLSSTSPAESARNATHGEDYTTTITADAEHNLPATIEVKLAGTTNPLTAGTDYTYTINGKTATLVIKAAATTGVLSITAAGVEIKTPLESATITFSHAVGTVPTDEPPHVGDTLRVTVAPANAAVSYKWQRGDSANGTFTDIGVTSQTYDLAAADQGKYVRVVLTGTGKFEGEKTSAAVGPVRAAVASAITLNKTTATVEYGKTETLSVATVTPEGADKTVTWSVASGDAVTVDAATGVVTAVKVGTATVRATATSGVTATCTVTVTRATISSVSLDGTLKVGQTVTVKTTPANATLRTIMWYRVADNGTETPINETVSNSPTYQLTADDQGYKIKVAVEATDNYSGSVTFTTDTTVLGEGADPAYAITVNKTGNGTVAVKVDGAQATTAAEGKTVTIEVTGVATGATVAVTTTTAGVTLTAGTNNTWTFRMPAKPVAITVTITASTTVDKTELNTAITNANAAKEGVLTSANGSDVPTNKKYVTEAEMKALTDAIAAAETVKSKADATQTEVNSAVTTLNSAITTFNAAKKDGTQSGTTVNKTALNTAITDANTAKSGVTTQPEGTDPATVSSGTKFVTPAQMKALTDAITAAETVKNKADATQTEVDNAVTALNNAVTTFNGLIKTGTKQSSSSGGTGRPSTTTTTKTEPDGTKVTTVTKADGSKTVTTETPDGTTEVVETKKDGTVTETVTDPDGSKTEKVTTPDKAVTITATDKDGEEVAKVEIPATVPAPETGFVDLDPVPWAETSINHAAGLKLVHGIGDNKYDPVAPITRGALATVFHRMSQGKSTYEVTFKDVAEGQYYTEGVAWAAKVGVVKGLTDEVFAPEQTITREQMAVMLVRYAKLLGMDTTADAAALEQFTDGAKAGEWAVDGLAWCVEQGILKGKGGDVLDPTANVTRAEVAVMLDRFIALVK